MNLKLSKHQNTNSILHIFKVSQNRTEYQSGLGVIELLGISTRNMGLLLFYGFVFLPSFVTEDDLPLQSLSFP